MLKLAALAVFCCAVVYAQLPKPCVSPKQWEARVMRVDPSKDFDEHMYLSYDAINTRIRSMDLFEVGTKRERLEILDDFKTKKRYVYNPERGNCTTEDIKEDFRPIEVPQGSRSRGEVTIGTSSIPGAGILVNMWEAEFGEDARALMVFTNVGCIPVTDYFFSKRSGMVHTSMFDVTPGIHNVTIFTPPSACTKTSRFN